MDWSNPYAIPPEAMTENVRRIDNLLVDLEFPRGVIHLVNELDGDAITLKSGRTVTLNGTVTREDAPPLTPDERREIAAEMIHRWMKWSEG